MIAQVAATALVEASSNARAYRITVHSKPAAQILERVRVPQGWVGAFCTPRVCSVGHVTVLVPASGVAISELHLYRVSLTAAHHVTILFSAGDTTITLRA